MSWKFFLTYIKHLMSRHLTEFNRENSLVRRPELLSLTMGAAVAVLYTEWETQRQRTFHSTYPLPHIMWGRESYNLVFLLTESGSPTLHCCIVVFQINIFVSIEVIVYIWWLFHSHFMGICKFVFRTRMLLAKEEKETPNRCVTSLLHSKAWINHLY